MKKRILAFIATFTMFANTFLSASAFDRVFEIKIPVDVEVSNNAFALADVFQKNFEIDFSKIADSMGPNGFVLGVNAKPAVEMNLNLKALHVGLGVNSTVNTNVQLSKELFEFLGSGNANYTDGTLFKTSSAISLDAFLGADLDVVVKNKLFYIGVRPGIFIPLASLTANEIEVGAYSREDGISADINANTSLRTGFDLSALMNGNVSKAFNFSEMLQNGIGFDMAIIGGMNFGKTLTFNGLIKVPVYPGKLTKTTDCGINWNYNASINDVINNNMTSPDTPEFTFGETRKDDSYYINRPLRIFVDADYKPFGDIFLVNAGVGVGLRHPFAKDASEMFFYPEYSVGFGVNLVGLLKINASTSFIERLYVHKANLAINLRLVEVDVGVASVAADLPASLNGTGIGAYVVVAIGF